MLGRHVLDKIHKYDRVEPSQAAPRTERLGKEVFESKTATCSVPVSEIASTSQTPSWYSVGAAEVSRVHADLELFREAHRSRNHRVVAERAWLGQLCDWSHQIAIRRVKPEVGQWMIPLHHWSTSAVLVVPCERLEMPGSDGKFWFQLKDVPRVPELVVMCDLADWECSAFSFRSPCWQQVETHAVAAVLPPMIRRVESISPRKIQEVAAACGFWSLGKMFMSEFAAHLGIKVTRDMSLFDILLASTGAILGSNEEASLKTLRSRLATDDAKVPFADELLELPDVESVLTREDIKIVKDAQETVTNTKAEVRLFREQFAEKAISLRGFELKKKGRKKAWKFPLDSKVSQKEAANFCPDGGSIWRDRVDGAWCSHFPPFQRFSRSWKKYGENECLRLCLVDLWSKFCTVVGIPRDLCPLQGVLDQVPEDAEESMPTGASSSSSSGPKK